MWDNSEGVKIFPDRWSVPTLPRDLFLPMATYNLKYFKRASIYRPYQISYLECSIILSFVESILERKRKKPLSLSLSLAHMGMKIKKERKRSECKGAVVDDFDKSSREQSALTLGWHFKSIARVAAARTASFLRSEHASRRGPREGERDGVLTGGAKEGGDESEGYVFDVQKVIMGWFPVIISRAH